jgi:hypothetical protein
MKLGDPKVLKDGTTGRLVKVEPTRLIFQRKDGSKIGVPRTAPASAEPGGVYEINMDKVKEKMNTLRTGMYWTPNEGKNNIRILPPWNSEGLYFFTAALHYGFVNEDKKRAYPCLTYMGEPKCPICDLHQKLSKSTDPADRKVAKRLQRKVKNYSNIIDRKGDPNQVLIWGYSMKQLRTIQGYMEDSDWGNITDPKQGHDVIVERKGTGLQTKYEVRLKPVPSPINSPGWSKKLHLLDQEVIEPITYGELAAILKDNFGRIRSEKPVDGDTVDEVSDEEIADEE